MTAPPFRRAEADWRHTRRTDLALRLLGAALGVLSYLAITALIRLDPPPPPANPGAITYGLAAAGFLCGGFGAALINLGRHIFDEIEVSSRWGHYDPVEVQVVERSPVPMQPHARPIWPVSVGHRSAGARRGDHDRIPV